MNKANKDVKSILNLSSLPNWSSSGYLAKQKFCILLEEHCTNEKKCQHWKMQWS